MANFPLFHGITLAQNAYIENLHIEILTSDPVPVTAGRVWYNSTDKVFKQSTLDASNAVIVRSFATAEALAADVASLTARIDALGSVFNYVGLVSGGAAEASALDLSTLAAGGKDTGDYYKIDAAGWFKESTAGTPFYANIGDGLVWNGAGGIDKIDNTDSNVAGTVDYVAVSGSADTGFVVDLDPAFKTRLTTLESSVSGNTGDLSTLTTTVKTDLVSAINEVNANVTDVRTDFNALRFTFQSSSAATTHTIAHNLASAFVDFSVMVERADGSYYNDVVSVKETDNNTLTVYLAAAAKIKAVVTSLATL